MATIHKPPHQLSEAQSAIQAPHTSGGDAYDVAGYHRKAIEAGSLLCGPRAVATTRVPRRALIVAPVYKDDPNKLELTSAATDAMLMHKMLVQCGYEEQNIRILCDYVGGFLELADPTRQNILASLEWLTSNTQPGDHRFFYFSGYGERVLQEEDASRARCVRIGDEPEPDSRLHGVGCASDRAVKQNISDMHVAYYHEAIITRHREVRWGEQPQKLWTTEPALTKLCGNKCIMDCRIGGRITRKNTVKFRCVGRQSAPMVKHPFGALENAPASPTPDEESNGPLTPDCDSVKVTSDKTLAVTSLANSSRTWMSGDMPVQRRQANHMQAKTFIWSGCHQRQVRDLHGSGILTRVFTSIFEVDFAALSAGSMTYEALFRRISEELAAQPSATISSQLFQLWISDEGQPVMSMGSRVAI